MINLFVFIILLLLFQPITAFAEVEISKQIINEKTQKQETIQTQNITQAKQDNKTQDITNEEIQQIDVEKEDEWQIDEQNYILKHFNKYTKLSLMQEVDFFPNGNLLKITKPLIENPTPQETTQQNQSITESNQISSLNDAKNQINQSLQNNKIPSQQISTITTGNTITDSQKIFYDTIVQNAANSNEILNEVENKKKEFSLTQEKQNFDTSLQQEDIENTPQKEQIKQTINETIKKIPKQTLKLLVESFKNAKINTSVGLDMLAVNNVKTTGYMGYFFLQSKYLTTDNRVNYDITEIAKTQTSNARRTEFTEIWSNTRFELNDLGLISGYNMRNIFAKTSNLKSQNNFEKIDFLKYTFISLYSRVFLTNQRNPGNFDQQDAFVTIGPGLKYKFLYLSTGFGKAYESEANDRYDLTKGYKPIKTDVKRISIAFEKTFKYITKFDDEIKIKGELSYNEMGDFGDLIQRKFSLSKKLDKYSTLNFFYSRENIKYRHSTVLTNNRQRISVSFLIDIL